MGKRIIVDADSCPVKKEILQVTKELVVPVIFVASYAHFTEEMASAEVYYVDSYSQSVDLFIANLVKAMDIVVTGDYGLTSMVLKPGVQVLSFRGIEFTQENMGGLLMQRHYSSKQRRSGERIKGPKAMTNTDKEKFVENLRKILNL